MQAPRDLAWNPPDFWMSATLRNLVHNCTFVRAAERMAALIDAGAALNALAHRANGAEELPPADELLAVLAQVDAAVRGEVGA